MDDNNPANIFRNFIDLSNIEGSSQNARLPQNLSTPQHPPNLSNFGGYPNNPQNLGNFQNPENFHNFYPSQNFPQNFPNFPSQFGMQIPPYEFSPYGMQPAPYGFSPYGMSSNSSRRMSLDASTCEKEDTTPEFVPETQPEIDVQEIEDIDIQPEKGQKASAFWGRVASYYDHRPNSAVERDVNKDRTIEEEVGIRVLPSNMVEMK